MENQWEAIFMYANATPDHPYLPNVEKPVYILGVGYSALEDRDAIASHLRSLFWMTYRKGFAPIVTQNGPTSDAGWGCMHRCGQMMLAEATTRVILGSSWRWTSGCQNEVYNQLRRMFQDNKSALYSIQNITMLGMAVDKPIGSWFGPNTVAQVIKKLSAYDPTTKWHVHISVEDGVILDEIKLRCRTEYPLATNGSDVHGLPVPSMLSDGVEDGEWNLEAVKARFTEDAEVIDPPTHVHGPVMRDLDEDFLEIVLPPTFESDAEAATVDRAPAPPCDPALEPLQADDLPTTTTTTTTASTTILNAEINDPETPLPNFTLGWRPLLLFVPLRLGLHQPNPCYFEALKAVFRIPQCVGIMGGRPSHAVWIVGTVGGDELVCLDPHVTQPASCDDLTLTDDQTHHCDSPVRISLQRLDPSMVIGFICPTEASLDDLFSRLTTEVLSPKFNGGHPLFELHTTRPANLPPLPCMTGSRGPIDRDSTTEGVTITEAVQPDDVDSSMITTDAGRGRLGGAADVVRNLLSKCNQVAGDTMRSLATGYRGNSNGCN